MTVSRNYRTPPATIFTYSYRLVHLHTSITYTRQITDTRGGLEGAVALAEAAQWMGEHLLHIHNKFPR